jgi:arabinogalactan oligomer/maltooligosaccharide transport system permease protein
MLKMSRAQLVITHLVLIVFTLFAVVPIIWVVLTSLKTESEVFSGQLRILPLSPTLDNFGELLSRGDFLGWAVNSIFVAVITTIVGVFLASTCAYALSRFRFRGRSASLYLFLVAQMFPGVILLVALYQIFTSLGLLDTPWALVLAYSTISIPFSILMLKGFFDTIPWELEEAARVDGVGVFGSFWRIVIPLSIPGIAVTAFYSFITAWNEFLLARSFLTSREQLTLPVGTATFVDAFNQPWALLSAASVLISVPVIIFFYAAQRYLLSGLTTGGVKG